MSRPKYNSTDNVRNVHRTIAKPLNDEEKAMALLLYGYGESQEFIARAIGKSFSQFRQAIKVDPEFSAMFKKALGNGMGSSIQQLRRHEKSKDPNVALRATMFLLNRYAFVAAKITANEISSEINAAKRIANAFAAQLPPPIRGGNDAE